MFLSNPCKSFLLTISLALIFQACGSSHGDENKTISLTDTSKSQFPFPTKQPEVYQGDCVISNGMDEEHYFVARKGDKWRFDIKRNNVLSTTELRSDRVYFIDHTKKTYVVEPSAGADAGYFNTLTWGFFRGANYLEFEEVERGNGQVKYRAKTSSDSKDATLITIDVATGMMVRQEITSQKDQTQQGSFVNYIYEVRDLKVDVDDSVFEIPAGYRQVTR